MALIILILLTLLGFLVIHFTVLWLEKSRASSRKAGLVLLAFLVAHNIYLNTVGQADTFLDAAAYLGFTSILVWGVFKLKPVNAATVAATFLVSRVLLAYLVG